MEITIKKWRLEPRTSADVRTIILLIGTDLPEVSESLVTVHFSGSLMTQLGDYISAHYNSEAFVLQLGRLAAALLRKEFEVNPDAIYNPDLRFGYMTESFPYGAVEIPDIETPENWKFVV
jgi:hypothetical protein